MLDKFPKFKQSKFFVYFYNPPPTFSAILSNFSIHPFV